MNEVIYLHHSGFAVELDKTVLIFDPITSVPAELLAPNKTVIFFVSHGHADHFDPKIMNYSAPNVHYVLSDDIPALASKDVTRTAPYQSFCTAGTAVKTFGSTDMGVSFLIECEGKTIFYAGDLNWWAWDTAKRPHINPNAEERDYKSEIERLRKTLGPNTIDLAFVPADPRLDADGELKACLYFIDTLHPKELVPMHFWGDFAIIDRLKQALGVSSTLIGTFSKPDSKVVFTRG